MVDVSDVKGLLRAFDGCMTAPVRNAVGMLRRVTEAIAKQPDKYELLDPGEGCGVQQQQGSSNSCSSSTCGLGTMSQLLLTPAWSCADNCEEWRSAGGDSYCDNVDFPGKVCSRWRELLSRPGEQQRVASAGSSTSESMSQAACGMHYVVTYAAGSCILCGVH
jgi:hypothetical protein